MLFVKYFAVDMIKSVNNFEYEEIYENFATKIQKNIFKKN